MATFLFTIGRFSFRRRWFVAVFWVGLLVLAGLLAAQAPAAPPNDDSMPGTEAQQAYDLLDERFPGSAADGATARVVFHTEHGKVTDAAVKETVTRTVGELGTGSQVARVTDPYATGTVSADGTTAYTQVTYEVPANEVKDSARSALLDTVDDARSDGLTVEAGGNAVSESMQAGHSSEAIGLAVAALVLVVTFGSLVTAGLPLLTALLGVAIGVCAIRVLSEPLGLGSTTSVLASMLGLAVGIDYALFVVSRYRSELARGRERADAAGHAVGTAGSAVVFAGLTVMIALAGLSVVGIPMLTQMGLAAAGTVLLAVLVAVTLVPALLAVAGRRIEPAADRASRRTNRGTTDRGEESREREPAGVRWAGFVMRRPRRVLLAGVVVLGVLAIPVGSLELALGGDESKPASTTQRRAYDLVAEGFGPGCNGPLTVVLDAGRNGDAKVSAETAGGRIRGMDGVASVGQPRFDEAGTTAVLTVVPDSTPSGTETTALVDALRESALEQATDAKVLVTGVTAMNADVSQKLSDALVPYLVLVVGLAFLLLIAVFRSVLVPLKAALGFLLTILAGLGVVVAVFQWGRLAPLAGVEVPGPVVSMMPIFMVGVVFGLAMDYEVFLVTRMRESYVHGRSPREAIADGFRHNARVVTAAAVIMISVFAAFTGSDEQMVKTIGLGLAVAVLLDAFVVRMTLVPAVLALLGDRAWRLPRWLDRLVPDVDVEGEKLVARDRREPVAAAASSAVEPARTDRAGS
ncbi:membrane protein [Streptomyces minutiscleroticus]|uniref:Membrane protein n=1 Tax=Streptomyces minutiscleroticus TaxID=68238 RepID=A0A918NI79_9ACTN|nr:MMPL family transporter [Streptomyces minutiscleroticus]GGX69379.1 membrane protein [Streptomyces minutiscleroticus]